MSLILIGSLSVLLYQSEQEKLQEVIYRRGAVVMARLLALTVEAPLLLAASMEYKSEKLFQKYEENVELIKRYTAEAEEIRAKCPEIKVDFKEDLQKQQTKILELCAKFAAKRKENSTQVLDSLISMSRELNTVGTSSSQRMHDMVQHGEDATLVTRLNQEQIRNNQTMILLAGLLANVLAGIGLAIFYRTDILQRIRRITGNTIALSRGEPMKPELTGGDEIALVDRAFHEMHKQLLAASERESALFENASDVICVLNEDQKFARVNPVCKLHWGFEPAELNGKSLAELLPAEELVRIDEKIAEAKAAREAVSFECKIATNEKTEKDMLWSLYWSESEKSLFCIVHDVSEQKKLERAKAQFLTMISSNLKLPLHSIAAALKNLVTERAQKVSELALSKLTATSSNVQRLVTLVDDLLLMNDAEFGKNEIRKENCCVKDILQGAVQDVEALAEKKQIDLQIESVDKDWLMDGNRIIQVLVNLISNAVKFSPENSTVRISAEDDTELLRFKVTDNGRGIPDSQIKGVFEKFSQVEAADGKRQAGSGLGLPICKQIVEDHGGEIGVESHEGKGSTFWFTIPLLAQERARELAWAHDPGGAHWLPAGIESQSPSISSPAMPAAAKSASLIKFPVAKLGLTAKGAILVGIPIICEIALVCCLSVILLQVDRERANELHERLVSNAASTLMIACVDAQTTMGHEYNDKDWQKIKDDVEIVHKTKDILYELIAKSPKELDYLRKAEKCLRYVDESYAVASKNVAEENGVFLPFAERHSMIPTLLRLFHDLKNIVESAESKERLSPTKQQELRQAQWLVLILGLQANIVSSILLALYFSRDINSRLMVLADNARRLATDEPLNQPLSGVDDIARLDNEFHKMAAALIEARKKERAVFDNSQDIICVLDENAKFLSINPASLRMLGYSRDELLQQNLVELSAADDRERTRTVLAGDGNALHFALENRVVLKSGSVLDIDWSFSRKTGKPTVYCIGHDISARKQLEQLKQDFLAMVSHDLRTPLTAIHGTTQLTAHGTFGPVAEEELETLKKISSDCRSLVELISDLLDLEKLEAGKMNLEKDEVELGEVLNKSIAACKDKERVKLEYTLELDETIVAADFDRLTQAFATIIAYAAEDKEDRVRVRLENNNSMSLVKVYDTGSVLSDVEKEELFQRQSRLSMALARCIVEHHGGSITVESAEDGNLFCLNLPNISNAVADDPEDYGDLS